MLESESAVLLNIKEILCLYPERIRTRMLEPIFITTYDYVRLMRMIESFENVLTKDHTSLKKLLELLDTARVIPVPAIGQDIVTMNSRIKLKDIETGQIIECELVYPQDADSGKNKVSILAPEGVALLGYSVGDNIQWPVSPGVRTMEIEGILYQPEAAGQYDL